MAAAERIDVLAVMDGFANRASYDFPALTVAELREARAAVAELIEAATAVERLATRHDGDDRMFERLHAAVVRAGGAA